jgi:hypothetical protein
MVNLVTHGRAGLPGPIGNVYIGRSATVYVVASGKSNHAGSGNVLLANQRSIGIEVGNNGVGEPWSAELTDTYRTTVRALLAHMGKDANSVYTHASHTSRKIDPAGPTTVVGIGPGTWKLANVREWIAFNEPPTPAPPTQTEDEMTIIMVADGSPAEWITNGVTRRWIQDTKERNNWVNAGVRRFTSVDPDQLRRIPVEAGTAVPSVPYI